MHRVRWKGQNLADASIVRRLQELEAYLGGVVTIKSDPAVHQEQFDIALA